MTQTTLGVKSTPINIDNEPVPEVWYINSKSNSPGYRERYYRVIIGATSGRTIKKYHCYRSDYFQKFVVDDFDLEDQERLCDSRFIFTKEELNDLYNHLASLDDNGTYCVIAQLGTFEIDLDTLLPIIRS